MSHSPNARILSLSLILLGGMLCLVPYQFQESVSPYLYDTLSPGVGYFKLLLKTTPAKNIVLDKVPLEFLQQCSLLWAENSRLKNLESEIKNSPLQKLPVRQLSPLISAEIIPARILTVSQVSRWQRELIMQTNQQQTISPGDFVVRQTEFLIDQGELTGVSPESLLLTGSVVIGQITHVGWQTAKVKSIVDTKFRGAARLLRQSPQGPVWGALGSLQGTGQTHCKLDYIKITEPVAEGDYVVAINPETRQFLGPVYGRVTKVAEQTGKTDWQIEVTPLSTLDPLTHQVVYVLTEKLNPSRVLQVSHEEEKDLKPVQLQPVLHAPLTVENFPGSSE